MIDFENFKDLDDVFFVEKFEYLGVYCVGVYVVDVSYFVQLDIFLDEEVLLCCFFYYFGYGYDSVLMLL